MSRICSVCGRGGKFGKKRSHSNIATSRKFGINIQSKKVDGQRVKICTKCVKTKVKPERKRTKKSAPTEK